MLKLIFKNLWQRRRQNAWLFAELIIVTILTWVIIDPTVVGIYDINSDLGYDVDRIVRVTVKVYPKEADRYNPDYESDEAKEDAYRALLTKASQLPKVEICSYLGHGIDDFSTINTGLRFVDETTDTVIGLYGINLTAGEKFFTLYGIQSTEGSPSADQLDSGILGENDIVITESVDRTFWPERRGVKNKRFVKGVMADGDTIYRNVAAIVKDFKYHAATRTGAVTLQPERYDYRGKNWIDLTLRLADGENADDYVSDFRKTITEDLRVGNYYVADVVSQREQIAFLDGEEGISTRRNLHFFIAALFLVNLIIGVVGCVWLQTGKRLTELGVLRSYGALKSQIIKLLIGESVIMATVAFMIGDLIYLQYALKEGLSIGHDNNAQYIAPADIWVNNFAEHFAIVSAIVYVIIILCVILGTYFPARHVSRIEPVDALRDE